MNSQTGNPPPPVNAAVRLQRYHDEAPPRRFFLHPKAGLLILAVDWFFFGPELFVAPMAVITSPLAFLITSCGVYWIQRRGNGDSGRAALLKALLAGVVAGIPTSIAGTIVGTTVLMLSGLSNWNQRRGDR